MRWEVRNNKILADGKEQDFAVYLWSLETPKPGAGLLAIRKLLVDERRMPVFRRLGFGRDREAALADLRELAKPELVQLARLETVQIDNGERRETLIVTIPAHYRKEVTEWLKKARQEKLLKALGLSL